MTSAVDADTAVRPTGVVRLDSLTSLRFFAALVVVVHHAGWMWTTNASAAPVFDLGYVGVSFFFVLSGFVLTWSLTPTRTWRRFYWLRFARIWPMHAMTTVYAGLAVALTWIPATTGVAAIATLTQGWSTSKHTFYGLNGVSWSLSCEAFFYLLFPVLVTVLVGRSRRALATTAGAVVVVMTAAPLITYGLSGPNSWVQQHAEWLFFVNPAYRLGEFVIGIVAAAAFRSGWRAPMSLSAAVGGALGTVGFVIWLELDSRVPFHVARPYFAMLLLPWFALIISAAAGHDVEGRDGLLRSRSLVFLGEASFALYMTHQLLQRAIDWSVVAPHHAHSSARTFFLFTVSAVIVAAATHLLVEQPAERWLRRRRVGLRRDPPSMTEPWPKESVVPDTITT